VAEDRLGPRKRYLDHRYSGGGDAASARINTDADSVFGTAHRNAGVREKLKGVER